MLSALPELLFLTDPKTENQNRRADDAYHEIAVFPAQLRHIDKVHAVPAGEQREGKKDRRDNGEDLHHTVLPDIDLRLKRALDLPAVFTQELCVLPQAGNTPLKKTKSLRFRFRKETVLVFAQLARHVVELRIISQR